MKTALAIIAVAIVTWFMFGPVAAFHHDVAYGVFGYMFSRGEDADAGDFILWGERFRFFPGCFAMTVAVWLGLVTIIVFLFRASNRSDQQPQI